jgi:hypothetical protein
MSRWAVMVHCVNELGTRMHTITHCAEDTAAAAEVTANRISTGCKSTDFAYVVPWDYRFVIPVPRPATY